MKKTILTLLFSVLITNLASAQQFTNMYPDSNETAPSYARLTANSYKVEGDPNIENFFVAIIPGLNRFFYTEKNIKQAMREDENFEIDTKNGFIRFFEEGSGSLEVQACYWNTRNKQKMMAVYFDEHDFAQSVCENIDEKDHDKILTSSFLAFFLYNAETKTLESIEPPIMNTLEMPEIVEKENNTPKTANNQEEVYVDTTPIHFICQLPQRGKDIKYCFSRESELDTAEWKTLKFNGLMFE